MTRALVSRVAVVTAGALTAGLAVLATPAHAAPQDPPAGWVLRDKYWTFDGCNSAGQQGIGRGAWDQYQCANGRVFWVLWTNR
ncbi:hypothetical protein [Streptantibioticus cattleyicolor]|uniref:Secreted protein n=1 Tax=Streptantibioticus cattleyicolor (strain ATCC 35852 / DSM 46488 / JCM 4925 / NBRC 14057 / NRRL 8057) TaxID=1003195 RepID=F8JMN7_STREN|nr:hypothetical protein [Streptantibioticus cattleyicolor]AEW98823.1 hypothetical protein SCATT_p06300 [Streptantibioticus cattleyicolor NRRL 8057 = DSM 46488]CCB72129.1 conserved exported protein of unknown function [Streptantibioticus cattleyicolor NRRL 8057 = DSM 46488]